jgi:hypothetical protein
MSSAGDLSVLEAALAAEAAMVKIHEEGAAKLALGMLAGIGWVAPYRSKPARHRL